MPQSEMKLSSIFFKVACFLLVTMFTSAGAWGYKVNAKQDEQDKRTTVLEVKLDTIIVNQDKQDSKLDKIADSLNRQTYHP